MGLFPKIALSLALKKINSIAAKKIMEIVGEYFQIVPRERLYLEPGAIAKTSSGKIRHQHNRQRFLHKKFEGLIERIFSLQDGDGSVGEEKKMSLVLEIMTLFENIVSLKPGPDEPILECGADSIVIVEFVDQIEKKFQQDFKVEEDTTLNDLVKQLKQI